MIYYILNKKTRCIFIPQVQKAEVIISVEEKVSNLGEIIKEEYGSLKKTAMELKVDNLLQQLMDNATEFGAIHMER